MMFYLPESRDLVDPGYNFRADRVRPGREGTSGDVYAHQLLGKCCCDGYLVSRSLVARRRIVEIRHSGGIHDYLRLPQSIPIMGDCGAFQYVAESQPPYTCAEICDYYQNLGFDYGITLDHIVTQFDLAYDECSNGRILQPTKDMHCRYELSLSNAIEMLRIIERRKCSFIPVGSAQGWSPKSYAAAVGSLARAGFKYVALGGVARASDEVIRSVLAEVGPVVRSHKVAFHVLGVARPSLIADFRLAGVSSCDSASPILQAFKSSTDNYYTPLGNYTAVRIPPVTGDPSPRVRKLLNAAREKGGDLAAQAEERRLVALEQAALKSVRAYASRKLSLAKAMAHLVRYDDEFAESKSHYVLYEKTLRDRPWEKCPCAICRALGVEVVILRGNNRNRRRGFHNTYVFYKLFKAAYAPASSMKLQS